MDKYIDAEPLYNQIVEKEELARQRVIDTPSRFPNGNINPYATRYATQLDERTTFKFMLTDAPAADVVEVVRCKDCKHNKGSKHNIDCEEAYWVTYPEDYCSKGERKDG